jgi:hypothetical protein
MKNEVYFQLFTKTPKSLSHAAFNGFPKLTISSKNILQE